MRKNRQELQIHDFGEGFTIFIDGDYLENGGDGIGYATRDQAAARIRQLFREKAYDLRTETFGYSIKNNAPIAPPVMPKRL